MVLDKVIMDNISKLSDKELIKMVTINQDDFTPEAIEYAKREIDNRGINDISQDEFKRLSDIEESTRQFIIEQEEGPQPNGINGWLGVPAIALCVYIIKSIITLYIYYTDYKGAPDVIDGRFFVDIGVAIIMTVSAILVAVLFFRKKRTTKLAFIFLVLASIITESLRAYLYESYSIELPLLGIGSVVQNCVFGLVWIPYFLRSKRVKNTFIR